MIEKYKSLPTQVKASFWFLICSFVQRAISMLTTPIFTRLLSTAEYGQFGVFISWYNIAIVIIPLSLSAGVHTQGLVKFSQEKEVFSSSLQGLTAVLVFFWGGVYFFFRSFWNDLLCLSTIQMVSMLVMVWTFSIFGFWGNEQRVNYQYRWLVIVTLLVSFAKPILGIFLVINCKDKVTARIVGLAIVEIIAFLWMFFYQIKKGGKFFYGKYWKYAIMFNLPLVLHYLSSTVLSSADRIMIENMVGDSEAGIYSLSYSISSIMLLFNTALSQTFSPWIYQKIKNKMIKDIAPIAYITLVIVAVVNLLLILFAPEAVAIFAPKSYSEAVIAIPPVAMSVFFMYCYDLFAKFAFYYEKTFFIMLASVSGAVLNIILNYLLIPKFGYVAAGYTTLICYMAFSGGHFMFMNMVCKKYCDGIYPYNIKKIIAVTFTFMTFGFLLLFTYNYPYIRYGIAIITIIICFCFKDTITSLLSRIISLRRL